MEIVILYFQMMSLETVLIVDMKVSNGNEVVTPTRQITVRT